MDNFHFGKGKTGKCMNGWFADLNAINAERKKCKRKTKPNDTNDTINRNSSLSSHRDI